MTANGFHRYSAILFGFFALMGIARSQQSTHSPAFDVASIKSTRDPFGGMMNSTIAGDDSVPSIPMPDPSRVRIVSAPILTIVAMAYRVPITRVIGPSWMTDLWFGIEAKLPPGAQEGQVHEMLQSLLSERFGLLAHWEHKLLPGYAMLVSKGGATLPASKAAELTPREQDRQTTTAAAISSLATMRRRVAEQSALPDGISQGAAERHIPRLSTAGLAALLGGLLHSPVTDLTGLRGEYDVTLRYSTAPGQEESSVVEAVERLGLKLERRRVPVDLLAIDKISKTPTSN